MEQFLYYSGRNIVGKVSGDAHFPAGSQVLVCQISQMHLQEIPLNYSGVREWLQGFLEYWDTLGVNFYRQVARNHGSQMAGQGSITGPYFEKNVLQGGLSPSHDTFDNPCIS